MLSTKHLQNVNGHWLVRVIGYTGLYRCINEGCSYEVTVPEFEAVEVKEPCKGKEVVIK